MGKKPRSSVEVAIIVGSMLGKGASLTVNEVSMLCANCSEYDEWCALDRRARRRYKLRAARILESSIDAGIAVVGRMFDADTKGIKVWEHKEHSYFA